MKVPVEDIRKAYAETRSVWKAGKIVGLSGQRVAQIMDQFGIPRTTNPKLSEEDKEAIKLYYETTPADEFDLDAIANSLGRTKQFICRHARKLGLTDKSRPHSSADRLAQSETTKALWKEKPHPRGYLGRKHGDETRQKISDKSKLTWAIAKTFGIGNMSPENLQRRSDVASAAARFRSPHKTFTKGAGGRREDIGNMFFRSSWEANYARYLNILIKMGVVETWDYEPETFWFESIKRGVRSYLPDFKVKYRNDPTPVYVEVKGWVMAKDHTKWKRMKKYHPHIKLEIVGAKEYRAIQEKWASAIPNWERRGKRQ